MLKMTRKSSAPLTKARDTGPTIAETANLKDGYQGNKKNRKEKKGHRQGGLRRTVPTLAQKRRAKDIADFTREVKGFFRIEILRPNGRPSPAKSAVPNWLAKLDSVKAGPSHCLCCNAEFSVAEYPAAFH